MSESSTIAEPMSDNQALREILGELRTIDSSLRATYSTIDTYTQVIGAATPLTRQANPEIVKTVVTNIGDFNLNIYEEGAQVAIVQGGKSWVSPLAGNGEITVMAPSGSSSVATIASYKK